MKLLHDLKAFICFLFFCVLVGNGYLFAQQTTVAPPGDTLKEVQILNSKKLTIKTVNDTTKLTIIVGDVKMRQGNSLFYCDSCVINNNTQVFEAWGHVHINDSDTTDIYASHLHYLIRQKIANLDGGVTLTDGKATLTTPDLEYNMDTNLGIYKHGGKVVSKKTTLVSQEGWYFSDLKDAYFKRNVLLKDPAYNIVTDSLLYNAETQTTRFISFTTITDSSGKIIKTRDGYVNQKTGEAVFGQHPEIIDGDTRITARTITNNDSLGISIAEGNAVVVDNKNHNTIIAGIIYRDKKTDAFLATRKPLMIIKQDNDSIYVTADTLFSAPLTDLKKRDSMARALSNTKDTTAAKDSLKKGKKIVPVPDTVRTKNIIPVEKADSVTVKTKDSIVTKIKDSIAPGIRESAIARTKDSVSVKQKPPEDSLAGKPAETDSVAVTPRGRAAKNPVDSAFLRLEKRMQHSKDSSMISVLTLNGIKRIAINNKDSANRYFEAYHHVRIFNDSLQAACDSLFYSFEDSVFRMFQDPVVWAKESQITGDTILLFTKNKKADRMQAFENGFMVNKLDSQAYNQVKATRIDGYFADGNIDSLRAKGSAECIYYLQDEDSAYTGINESKCDIMDVYFRNKELSKVVFRSAVTGTLWPIRQKSPSEMKLSRFRWLEARRPKTKTDMFQ